MKIDRSRWAPHLVRPSLFALGLTALFGVARAQEGEAAPPVRPLGLAQALELASRQNLELAAARLRREVVRGEVGIASELPNPTLSYQAAKDLPHQGVLIEQPLELGGKRQRRIDVAHEEGAQVDAEIAALESDVRRDTRQAFYDLAAARAATAERQKALELARRLREIADARFASGDVARLEVVQAELEVARATADVDATAEHERVALARLNALLNEPSGTRFEIAGSLEDPLPPVALDTLLECSASSSPELQRLSAERRVEESRRELLRAERVPTVNVEFGADFDAEPEFDTGGRGGFSLVLPVFSRNKAALAQSAAQARVIDDSLAAKRRETAGRVEAAYYEWSRRQKQVAVYQASLLPPARQLAELAEESYRAGKTGILGVLSAQRDVQEIAREYNDVLLAAQTAFADLEHAVGIPLDATPRAVDPSP